MPTVITEASVFGTTCTAPADGDDLTAGSVTASGVGFQELTNRTRYLKNKETHNGGILWNAEISNASGSTDIIIGPIQTLVLDSASLTKSTTTTLPTSGLAADTWYYLYVYHVAGVIGFEYSTTVPDTARTFKDGTVTYRYLGCFRTDGSSGILPFRALHGRYTFRRSAIATYLIVLAAGNSASYADVALSSVMPPHSKIALLHATAYNSTADIAVMGIRSNGDTATSIYLEGNNSSIGSLSLEIETDDRIIEYSINAAAGAEQAYIYANGFVE